MSLREVLDAASPTGEWKHGYAEGVSSVAEAVEFSKHATERGTRPDFWLVSFEQDGENLHVCHTGNGARSPANAAFIAHACNNVGWLLDAVEAALRQGCACDRRGQCARCALVNALQR